MAVFNGWEEVDSLSLEELRKKYMGKLVRVHYLQGWVPYVGIVSFVGTSLSGTQTVIRLNRQPTGVPMRSCKIEIWDEG